VNQNSFPMSVILAIAILFSVCFLCGFGNIPLDMKYECAGKNDNGMVITREFPTLHFSGHQLKISGSDIFSSYNYEICGNNDTLVSFATQQEACRAGHEIIKSSKVSYGSLNKASGHLILYGSQELSGEYQCKAISKNY
jgi:hypothetical protein